ncbi:MAG TPA: winged helix-turn-helix domain-containing protein [Rhizomicrobium sp.]|jgi:Tol biopolymer transport system component/DNA-binding winged helix-turn-helix (wHTH) protein|nr:winged helix-turn-helix domain-containing protein [Rhizomicrobium sp.]
MNQRPVLLKPVGPASLADEGGFQLGSISVQPSLCEVSVGGARERLEPRVMQVLVALARANGAVLSRDDLILKCWGGRVVGEDAINRSVSRVRQLAALGGGRAFEIDTVPRVGYRLRLLQEQPPEAPAVATPSPTARPATTRPWRWAGLVGAAIALAAGSAAAVYYYLRPQPQWIVVESHLPFISTPAIERYPALSPDGTMIAYSEGRLVGDRHIALRLLHFSDPIQLTHDSYDASAPAWSPDGRTIAYVIFERGHPCRIMEIPVPSGQSHQIGQCRVSEHSSLAFDHSGRDLFYSDAPRRNAPDRILKLDLDTGHVSAITHPGGGVDGDSSPSVSPDNSALLYERDLGMEGSQIRILSLAGEEDRLVATARPDGGVSAAFALDGRSIFVSKSQGSDNSLWAYPLRGGDPWRILSSGEDIGRLSAGPNGLLAMELQYQGGQLVRVTPHSDQPPRPIDAGGLKTWCVDYAPDGTFLATGWHFDTFGIWISGANGSLHELVRLKDGWACAIRWSPDGTRFAYVQWRPYGFDVPVMTRAGQTVARLFYRGKESGRLDWTADGKSILTSRVEKGGWRIWRTDLATPDKSVPVSAFGWLSPQVHGTMLFAEKDGVPGIWRIDGPPRRVTDGPAPEASDVYTIAGDRLIYSDTTDPEHPMFSAQNIYGGPKDRLAPLPHGQFNFVFGVDPKSGDIVYTIGTDDTDIGLLRLEKR